AHRAVLPFPTRRSSDLVGALLGADQVVARAPRDDLAAELDERFEHLLEVDHLRPPADQRQHDDAERCPHLGVRVELVEEDLGYFAPAQFKHQTNALSVGLVPDLGDPFDFLLAAKLGDLLDYGRLVYLIWKFGDD